MRYILLVLLTTVLGLICAVSLSQNTHIYKYTSTSMVYVARNVGDANLGGGLDGIYQELMANSEIASDFTTFITSEAAYDRLTENLGARVPWLSEHQYDAEHHFIEVTTETQSRLINMDVTTDNAKDSAKIANECTVLLQEFCSDVFGIDSVQIIKEASPKDHPSSPTPAFLMLVGLGGGFIIGIGICVLIWYKNGRNGRKE
ncbi:MAG: hypothetical protein LBN22_08285 [Clostridiales Family XIII bacterium]|nr:hypothetical protein [Clostridiales Family XIII bacterium]